MIYRTMRNLISIILCLLLTSVVVAQPSAVDRTLRSFDFEERAVGNREDTPAEWIKVEGPGLPHYVDAKFATDQAHSGKYSFKFDLNGGSVIYRYPAGLIKVIPGATYRIETFVKTTALPNARARISTYFADIDQNPIKGSISHSEPFASAAGDNAWHKISIDVEATSAKCAFLVIEIGLVQPSIYKPSTLGKQALFDQDVFGSAWFDDIAIAQVPHVHLSTQKPGNIFRKSEAVQLKVDVSDKFIDDLTGSLLVRDASGKAVFQRSGALDLISTGQGIERSMWVEMPDLPAGWYNVSLVMASRGTTLGEHQISLIKLADDMDRPSFDHRFGIIATDLPIAGWNELPKLLPYLGVSRVKLAVWNKQSDLESNPNLKFDVLLERLREEGIAPTACLVDPPPKVQASIGGDSWAQLMRAKPETWQPLLSTLVSRHAGYLDRWQFGTDAQADEFVSNPQMRQMYAVIREQFTKLIQDPDIAMPWPAWHELDADVPSTVAMNIPPEILPSQLPLYIAEIKKNPKQRLSLSLQLLPAERYGREGQIQDFVKRIAFALSAGADRIDIPLPFTVSESDGEVIKNPSEMLLIERTVLTTLSDATYRGRVPIADDVEAFLFDRHGEGIMLLWNKGAQKESKKVDIVLGRKPARVDMYGNATSLMQPANDAGAVTVDIGTMPIFLVGIDASLAQLRTSVAVDNPMLESSFKPQIRKIRFTNPYPVQVTGSVHVTGPQGWNVTLQTPGFSLAPGATYESAITLEFPYNSFGGVKTLQADIQLQSDQPQRFRVPITMRLGLGDVGLETIAFNDKGNIIVQQMITNYSNKPINYTAYALYPGQQRQERLVMNLVPGATTIKKYRFDKVDKSNDKVRSGLKETEGSRILNDEVAVQ